MSRNGDVWKCDICGEPISDIRWGMLKFGAVEYEGDDIVEVRDAVLCHKCTCDDRKDNRDMWLELDWLYSQDPYMFLRGPLLAGERDCITCPAA